MKKYGLLPMKIASHVKIAHAFHFINFVQRGVFLVLFVLQSLAKKNIQRR